MAWKRGLAVALLPALAAGVARAQSWPTRPIEMIIASFKGGLIRRLGLLAQ